MSGPDSRLQFEREEVMGGISGRLRFVLVFIVFNFTRSSVTDSNRVSEEGKIVPSRETLFSSRRFRLPISAAILISDMSEKSSSFASRQSNLPRDLSDLHSLLEFL